MTGTYLKNRFVPILAAGTGWIYLVTLCPTQFYQDTPEFINTAFTLGISHPAGFPTYNLLAKALTFLPLGSIAFRVNLFSALAALAALLLAGAAGAALLRCLYGKHLAEGPAGWSVWVPVGYLAFCPPFWTQSLQAEVYTLHVAFTAALLWFLLKWRLQDDVRFLYLAALVYGLSAGNHATVGFYLPAVLLLFFAWCRQRPWVHLGRCAVLFLLGFSIYAYLPVRSMTEPSFDWGNPETVEGFLFQVTDRKDAHTHFSVLESSPGSAREASILEEVGKGILGKLSQTRWVIRGLAEDLLRHLSPVSLAGLVVGGVLCFRRSPALFGFFLILAGINVVFFYTWRQESYLPTYLVAGWLTTLALYRFLGPSDSEAVGGSAVLRDRWRPVVWAALMMLIPYAALVNFYRVSLADDYTAETLPKRMFLKLDSGALFIPGLSWFHYFYHQDVERLRDDVTAVPVWDLLNENPQNMLTRRRFPDLYLPRAEGYDLTSKQGQTAYVMDFMKFNAAHYPVIMEATTTFFEQTGRVREFQPHGPVFLKYAPGKIDISGLHDWWALKRILEEELKRPGAGRHAAWLNLPHFWMDSLALFAHETGRFRLEEEILEVMTRFFGLRDAAWQLRRLENLLDQGRVDEAETRLQQLATQAPDAYETWMARGLVARRKGKGREAVRAFLEAARRRPQVMRPYLEQARAWLDAGNSDEARRALEQARVRVTQLLEWERWKPLARKAGLK